MDENEPSNPSTFGEALGELGRHFKVGLSAALAAFATIESESTKDRG